MVLGITSAAALAGLQFGGKALSAFGGFMDNSAQQAKYNEDVQRVAAIDAKNQQTRGNDLKIFADYKNKGVRALEQLDNIERERLRQGGRSRLAVERAADETIAGDQDSFIKTMRRLRGGGAGRVNLDGSMMRDYSRQISNRLAQTSLMRDDLITGDYDRNFTAQNMAARELAAVGPAPRATPYITKFTPQDYSRNLLADSLKLGTGLMDAGFDAYGTFKSLQPDAIYEGRKQIDNS